jgi:hypothetical protein
MYNVYTVVTEVELVDAVELKFNNAEITGIIFNSIN